MHETPQREFLAWYFAEPHNSVTKSNLTESQIFEKQTLLLDSFSVGCDQYARPKYFMNEYLTNNTYNET